MMNSLGGIYAIVNSIDGKQYIGSAVNFCDRWRRHKDFLRKGAHHSRHLQSAWNIYGETAFKFIVLRTIENSIDLIPNEQEFIDLYHPKYNMCQNAGSTLGRPCSNETKEKISIHHADVSGSNNPRYGKKASEETRRKIGAIHRGKTISDAMINRFIEFNKSRTGNKNHQSKPVLQYSKDMKFIAEYESAKGAGEQIGVAYAAICKCCKQYKHYNTAGGFIWRYANNNQSIQNQNIGDTQ